MPHRECGRRGNDVSATRRRRTKRCVSDLRAESPSREWPERESFSVQLAFERSEHRLAYADARECTLCRFQAEISGDTTCDTGETIEKLRDILVVEKAEREVCEREV